MWRWNAVLAAEQGAGDSGEADLEARERRGACTRPGIRTTDGGWAASEGGVDEGGESHDHALRIRRTDGGRDEGGVGEGSQN